MAHVLHDVIKGRASFSIQRSKQATQLSRLLSLNTVHESTITCKALLQAMQFVTKRHSSSDLWSSVTQAV